MKLKKLLQNPQNYPIAFAIVGILSAIIAGLLTQTPEELHLEFEAATIGQPIPVVVLDDSGEPLEGFSATYVPTGIESKKFLYGESKGCYKIQVTSGILLLSPENGYEYLGLKGLKTDPAQVSVYIIKQPNGSKLETRFKIVEDPSFKLSQDACTRLTYFAEPTMVDPYP